MIKYISMFLVSALFAACSIGPAEIIVPPDPPQAAFSYTKGAGGQRNYVYFKNESLLSERWHWEFGDGATSDEANPTHIYTVAGTYKVRLTAYGSGRQSVSELQLVVLGPVSQAVITKVVVTSYSGTWDAGSHADIYPVLSTGSNFSPYNTVAQNLNPSAQYSWTLSPAYTITSLSAAVKLSFWDLDDSSSGDGDDLMDVFNFKPEDYTTGANQFPATVSFSGTVNGHIEVTWQ